MQHIKEELNIKAGIKKFKNWIKFADIHKICKKYDIKDYHINDDGTVDVYGNVDLWNEGLKEIPLKFGNIDGYFLVKDNNLLSLNNGPKNVYGCYNCSSNYLTNLEGAPEYIDTFLCEKNSLTNLIGSPRRINGSFDCSGNDLTSLEGCPEYIGEDFWCEGNKNLWSFDYFPRHAKGVKLYDTPIYPIFELFKSEYLADGGEFFSTSWSLMEFFWDMDPVYPGKIIMKWRMNKFLESLNKELTPFDIKAIEEKGWKIK